MRYITESELRASFSHGVPASYEMPADAKLTPAARQYLMDLRLYRVGAQGGANESALPNERATALHASKGEHGEGLSAKARVGQKPEHMTHLTSTRLVCKAHPRIELRGRLDALEAELLLVQLEAPAVFAAPLEDALELVRQTLAADVKERPIPDWQLDGLTAEQIHRASHHPEEFGYPGHIQPSVAQGRFPALLNRLRTMTRECELCAVRAYLRENDTLERGDVVLTLNRLSSYFYVLQLRAAAGKA
ncbi:MAG: hypothetical protein RR301_06325 [Clostridia bacterium]